MKTRLLASVFVVVSVMLLPKMLHSQTASQTTASLARDQGSSTDYVSLASQHSDIVLHAEVPLYPFLAVQARIQGTVHLRVFVEQGEVIKVEPDSPSDLRILAQAATENVKTWRFAPLAKGTFNVTYIFKLKREKAQWRLKARKGTVAPQSSYRDAAAGIGQNHGCASSSDCQLCEMRGRFLPH